MSKATVLVVDDDSLILRLINANLKTDNSYNVLLATDGESALKLMSMNQPDIVLLDLMMPVIDGAQVCRQIREWSSAAIIIISAIERIENKVQLLDIGADDYITKPFGVDELLARMRAVLRRKKDSTEHYHSTPVFSTGYLQVNFANQRVEVKGKTIHLTPIEYDLLKQFTLNPDKVLTHKYLLEKVWGGGRWDAKEYLRVYVRRLRHKIEDNVHNPQYILTKSGVGYCLQRVPSDLQPTSVEQPL